MISLDKSTMPGIRSSKRAPNEYGSHRRGVPTRDAEDGRSVWEGGFGHDGILSY